MTDNIITYSLSIFNVYFCGGPFLWRPLGTCPPPIRSSSPDHCLCDKSFLVFQPPPIRSSSPDYCLSDKSFLVFQPPPIRSSSPDYCLSDKSFLVFQPPPIRSSSPDYCLSDKTSVIGRMSQTAHSGDLVTACLHFHGFGSLFKLVISMLCCGQFNVAGIRRR